MQIYNNHLSHSYWVVIYKVDSNYFSWEMKVGAINDLPV